MENTDSASQSTSAKKSSSKVIPVIIVIILLIVLGAGAFVLMAKKTVSQQASSEKAMKSQPSPTSATMFSSIQEALSKSLSLECDYTDESGKKITTFIKNGAVRSDIVGATAKESSSVIMKDKKVYYWTGKTGTMMAFDISSMMAKITPSVKPEVSQSAQKPGDVMGSLEKFKKSCKAATVDSSLFTPPADVKFTDVSAMMQKVQAMPSGITGGMTEEQVKALQQKYQK